MAGASEPNLRVGEFNGPLGLLLELLAQKELDITDLALAEITEQYLRFLEKVEDDYPDKAADFLIVAARLVYLKSRTLLPHLDSGEESGEELLAS